MTRPLELHKDYLDMLDALSRHGVDYVVIGGFAVAAHGFFRATKDLDILVRATAANADRVVRALAEYGAPIFDATAQDFAVGGTVFQIGVAPRRIDILTSASGLPFEEAISTKIVLHHQEREIPIVGLEALLKNKRAAGRPEDRRDVLELEKLHDLKPRSPTHPRSKSKARRRK
ncbi:MAG: hypothetical protein A2138_08565 [Deltaproteobacteria bacterium RBG_16_71_12]|nr:MAG: hypothetical protein A2138_08565 [Deltaproteobacteria bacterium RBG_16_71_12]